MFLSNSLGCHPDAVIVQTLDTEDVALDGVGGWVDDSRGEDRTWLGLALDRVLDPMKGQIIKQFAFCVIRYTESQPF